MTESKSQWFFIVFEDGSTAYNYAPISEMFEEGERFNPNTVRFRAHEPMQYRENVEAADHDRKPRKVVHVYDISAEEMKARALPWEYEEDVKSGHAPKPRT